MRTRAITNALRFSSILIVAVLAACSPARADFAHWFFQAKIDLAKNRAYDVDPDGIPLADKRQGRSRTKLFGLVDVAQVQVCLAQGQWTWRVAMVAKKDDQILEFYVLDCQALRIRVHFDRPLETSDYSPHALVRYLSSIFDIHGFETEGLVNALGAALTPVSVSDSALQVGALELPRSSDYQPNVQRYGGGLRLISSAAKGGGKRYLWSTLLLSRPMTADEAVLGAGALAEEFRRDQLRLLNAAFGKKLKKKLEVKIADVQGAPHLLVQYEKYAYRRRDYLFDDASATIYYLESTAGRGKKDKPALDAAVSSLLAGARFRQQSSPANALSSLTEIPEASLAAFGPAAPAPPPAAPDNKTYSPAIDVVSVSVQPPETSPGDDLKLIIQYAVEGLPPGVSFEVNEVRELVLDGKVIATVKEPVARSAGTYTSAKTIQAPAGAKPGVYTLRATVSLAGVVAEGSALFRIR